MDGDKHAAKELVGSLVGEWAGAVYDRAVPVQVVWQQRVQVQAKEGYGTRGGVGPWCHAPYLPAQQP